MSNCGYALVGLQILRSLPWKISMSEYIQTTLSHTDLCQLSFLSHQYPNIVGKILYASKLSLELNLLLC